MSQINVFSELTLNSDRFIAGLSQAEAAARAWAARMNSIRVNLPTGSAPQYGRGGAHPAGGGSGYSLREMQPIVARFGEDQASFRQAVVSFERHVAEIGEAATMMSRAASRMGAPATAGGESVYLGAATGTVAGGPRRGGGGGRGGGLRAHISRYSVGGFAAFYGVNALLAERNDTNSALSTYGTHYGEGLDQQVAESQRSAIANDDPGTLMYWLRKGAFELVPGPARGMRGTPADPDEIRRVADEAKRSLDISERHADLVKKGIESEQEMEAKIAAVVGGAAKGNLAALQLWLHGQQVAAEAIRPANGKLADKMLSQAAQYAAAQTKIINDAAAAQAGQSQLAIGGINREAQAAQLSIQGRDRDAALLRRKGEITDRVRGLYLAAQAESDPVRKQQAMERYRAAAGAAGMQIGAIDEGERQFRFGQSVENQRALSDMQAQGRFAAMRLPGTATAEHAASLAEQNYAAYRTVRAIDDQVKTERDPVRAAQLRQQQAQANATAQIQVQANAAAEQRRIRESVADFMIGKDKAELSEHEKDFKAATKIFEEEWDKRIRAAQTAAEKEAAIAQRNAEREARRVAEERRVRHEVADEVIGAHRAQLSEASSDYVKETQIFNEQWDERIKKMQEAGEDQRVIDAANAQRQAEQHAREVQHERELREITRAGTEGYLAAAGRGELASFYENFGQLREELRMAGGDTQRRRALAYRERGRLQAIARGQISTGIFGSYQDYIDSAQSSVISGSGSILGLLQKEYQGLGKIMNGGDDHALFGASQALKDAADKLTQQNIFVLRDN